MTFNGFSDGCQDFVHGGKSLQVLSLLTGSKTGQSGEDLSTPLSGCDLPWKFASGDGATSLLIKATNDGYFLGTRAGFSTSARLTLGLDHPL